jgi:hypothetical protein
VLNSSLDKNVLDEEDVFGEREAASLTCVAVVQRRNELNLFDESLELKFLNSVQSAAPHWASRVTSKGVFKSQADKSTRNGEYEDLHLHQFDCRDAYEQSPLTVREVGLHVRKVLAVPSTSVFLVSPPDDTELQLLQSTKHDVSGSYKFFKDGKVGVRGNMKLDRYHDELEFVDGSSCTWTRTTRRLLAKFYHAVFGLVRCSFSTQVRPCSIWDSRKFSSE